MFRWEPLELVRPHRTVRMVAVAALTVLALAAPPSLAAGPGPLVIVGGGLSPDNEPIFRAILERKLVRGPICVLPIASAEPVDSAHGYVRDFERHGREGIAVAVNLTTRNPEKARDPEFAAQLERCGGYFFTGGDQSRIVDVLRPGGADTPAAVALRRAHAEGAVVAGSSAGAAMMSDPMIGAGSSREALRHGVSDEESGDGVWVRTGMGFLERGLTGQHFLARGRLGRQLVALAAHPEEGVGIGVDEDTAAIVDGSKLSVVGRSQVAVTIVRAVDDDSWGLSARLWLLGDGDRFDLSEATGGPAEGKSPLPRSAAGLDPPSRPFEEDRLHRLLVAFSRSERKGIELRSAGTTLAVNKPDGFRAWARADESNGGVPDGFGAGPFELRLVLPEGSP